jgi:hypothetical protein
MVPKVPADGTIFVTPSGRRWKLMPSNRYDRRGTRCLQPLGSDTYGFGGVKRMFVSVARLDGEDRVWKIEER